MSKSFTKNAFSTLKKSGTLFPSSRFLANKISKLLPENTQCLVELGAGNGAVTKSLLNALEPQATIDTYEINQDFIKLLNTNVQDPRLNILERSAWELANDFEENSVDAVVSCLPLALFSDQQKHELLEAVTKVLRTGGRFIQYQYSLKDFKFVKQYFGCNKYKFVLLNIPPAFIYHCKKCSARTE